MKSLLSLLRFFLAISTTCTAQTEIRDDGFYSSAGTDSGYSSRNMLVFTNNGKIRASPGATLGNEPYSCDYFKTIRAEQLGKYEIKGDSIFAMVPFSLKKGAIIHANIRSCKPDLAER